MRMTLAGIAMVLTFYFSCLPLLAQEDQKTFLDAVAARDTATVGTMLERDPALANARRPNGNGAVVIAMFAIAKGEEAFHDPKSNELLRLVLAAKPRLDLFETAAVGTAEQLETMLRADPSALSRRSPFGWTLLHMASFGGNVPAVELLIKRGADVNDRAKSKFRNTPLQTALLCGQLGTARVLLDHGADPLVRQSKGATPMHEAALLGRIDLLQLLVDHGAELSSVSDNGRTPLAEAIRGKHPEAAEWLRSKGAVEGIQADEDAVKAAGKKG
ncbi:MAG TPA: ankyrin repeat domain-containing protein [Thermoanaerobaculia bacterium]|nr:ankyrin repeat domain-containing protein [Thermoanaerobaculia bacterium]